MKNGDIVIHGRTIKDIIEQKLILTSDLDSCFFYWITPQEAEIRKRMWEACIPKVEDIKIGKIFVYGTAGSDDIEGLEKMFYNPTNYGIVEKREKEDKDKTT